MGAEAAVGRGGCYPAPERWPEELDAACCCLCCSWFARQGREQFGNPLQGTFSFFFFNFSQIASIFSMFPKYNKTLPSVDVYLRYKYL